MEKSVFHRQMLRIYKDIRTHTKQLKIIVNRKGRLKRLSLLIIVNKKFINEPNVYRFIVKSKLPQAEQFEKWVFEDALPIIRKPDAYMTPHALNALLQAPDSFIGLIPTQTRTTSRRACIQNYIPRVNFPVKRFSNSFTNCRQL